MKISMKYLILLTTSGLVIALDQMSKVLILGKFTLGETWPLIEDILHFTYVRNYGAAFGFLAQSHPEYRDWFFLIIPPVALVFILLMLRKVAENDKVQILALSSIFGGAIGNYIDRLRFGYVVDFIDVHYKNVWNYPVFNLADSFIVVGVCALFLLLRKK